MQGILGFALNDATLLLDGDVGSGDIVLAIGPDVGHILESRTIVEANLSEAFVPGFSRSTLGKVWQLLGSLAPSTTVDADGSSHVITPLACLGNCAYVEIIPVTLLGFGKNRGSQTEHDLNSVVIIGSHQGCFDGNVTEDVSVNVDRISTELIDLGDSLNSHRE